MQCFDAMRTGKTAGGIHLLHSLIYAGGTMNRYMLIICISFFLLLAGCGESEEAAFESTLSIKNASGVETVEFYSGQEATVTLTVQNLSSETQVIETPSNPYEIFIVNSSGGTVWSSITSIIAVVTYQNFGPLEAKTYEALWGLADISNTPVPPGQYYVQGYMGRLDELAKQSAMDYGESGLRSPMVNVTVY